MEGKALEVIVRNWDSGKTSEGQTKAAAGREVARRPAHGDTRV